MPIKRATGRYKGTKFYWVGKGVGVAHGTVGISRRAKPWEREGAMLSSCFRRSEGKGIAQSVLETPKKIRELRRRLYQEAKRELRKSPEEDDRKAVFGKTERMV